MVDARELLEHWASREWRLHRVIRDLRRESESVFKGRATWRPLGVGAPDFIYSEDGLHLHDDREYPACRRYLYRAVGSTVQVCFEDAREFYSFSCGGLPRVEFEHACHPDKYRGTLQVESATWALDWEIHGPRKALRISTRGERNLSGD